MPSESSPDQVTPQGEEATGGAPASVSAGDCLVFAFVDREAALTPANGLNLTPATGTGGAPARVSPDLPAHALLHRCGEGLAEVAA